MGVTFRQSAAVLLFRERKLWLGQRRGTRFLPGFWVFPGGANDSGETHEEAARREVCEESGLVLTGVLRPLDRAITPAYAPVRFDTRIYAAEVPQGEEPQADGVEFGQGRWFDLGELMRLRDCGEVQLAPPTYRQLQLWEDILEGRSDWPSEQAAFLEPPLAHQQVLNLALGVTVIPLESGAMPPAAWTNTVVVGTKRLFVIDPGGADPGVLTQELERRQADGAEIAGIVLTHHHPDHLAGYLALGLTHLPLWCHSITAPLLPEDFPAPTFWSDREVLDVEPGLSMVAHWTPGHAPGHLTIEIPERRTLIAADLISSLSSIVIPSSNGDLVEYLDSLTRMRDLGSHLVIPSHGPSYGEGSDPFGQAIAHRLEREKQVIGCLAKLPGPVSAQEITATLYRGLDPRLMPAAQANIGHHLKKLLAEGRALEGEQGWSLPPDGTSPG